MCLPRALICLEPGTEGPLRLSQGTPFRSHVPCVQCPGSLYGNFLSRKTSASPHLHLGLTQQKGQQEGAAHRTHISLVSVSTSCPLDSGSQGEASWGEASEEGRDQPLLLVGSACTRLPLLGPHPGRELKRPDLRSAAAGPRRGAGLEVPPAVQADTASGAFASGVGKGERWAQLLLPRAGWRARNAVSSKESRILHKEE